MYDPYSREGQAAMGRAAIQRHRDQQFHNQQLAAQQETNRLLQQQNQQAGTQYLQNSTNFVQQQQQQQNRENTIHALETAAVAYGIGRWIDNWLAKRRARRLNTQAMEAANDGSCPEMFAGTISALMTGTASNYGLITRVVIDDGTDARIIDDVFKAGITVYSSDGPPFHAVFTAVGDNWQWIPDAAPEPEPVSPSSVQTLTADIISKVFMAFGTHTTVEFPPGTTGAPGTFTTCVVTETDGPRVGKPGHVIRAAFYENGVWEWSDTTPV